MKGSRSLTFCAEVSSKNSSKYCTALAKLETGRNEFDLDLGDVCISSQ